MPQLTVVESARSYLDWTLVYSSDWSVEEKQGEPVLEADTAAVYFTLKTNEDDAAAVLELDDDDENEIEWLDDGEVRVKLGTNTEGKAGTYYYELRVKLSGGEFITVEKGTLVIEESIVDTP